MTDWYTTETDLVDDPSCKTVWCDICHAWSEECSCVDEAELLWEIQKKPLLRGMDCPPRSFFDWLKRSLTS